MAGPAGKLSLMNLKGKDTVGPGEMELDLVNNNITQHYNEEIFSKLRPRYNDGSNTNDVENSITNGGLCTKVGNGRG